MLWMGVLSDPSGKLGMPGMGSIFYVAAVTAVAAFLASGARQALPITPIGTGTPPERVGGSEPDIERVATSQPSEDS